MSTSEAVVDLAAIRANVEVLAAATPAEVMAVVKADGYGHGLLPSARAALAGGASWLGVAQLDEALALRAGGIAAPVLAWLWAPDEADTLARAVAADVDISVSSEWALAGVVTAGEIHDRPARIHLKIDTGLSRNGSHRDQWPDLVAAAAKDAAAGVVEVVGIWSHLVYADAPGHPTIDRQTETFLAALDVAAAGGVVPRYRHLANSAATLTRPAAHFDLVRPGIAIYGLNPVPDVPAPQLRPAMTLHSTVALAKEVEAGQGVSYGHQYTTTQRTRLALVPLGYADGVPRNATNRGPVQVAGRRATISGRVCMDQFVVDVGDAAVAAGDEVLLFGPGDDGEPTAQDWADALDTIHYEIVTRIGPRVPRRYVGDPASATPSGGSSQR
ncbi:MAG: alanine racemase [Actinomycetota bacterium]|nr:alanine racemase [Actinomycetota bacterium]